jgi:hypothetical protein
MPHFGYVPCWYLRRHTVSTQVLHVNILRHTDRSKFFFDLA